MTDSPPEQTSLPTQPVGGSLKLWSRRCCIAGLALSLGTGALYFVVVSGLQANGANNAALEIGWLFVLPVILSIIGGGLLAVVAGIVWLISATTPSSDSSEKRT